MNEMFNLYTAHSLGGYEECMVRYDWQYESQSQAASCIKSKFKAVQLNVLPAGNIQIKPYKHTKDVKQGQTVHKTNKNLLVTMFLM